MSAIDKIRPLPEPTHSKSEMMVRCPWCRKEAIDYDWDDVAGGIAGRIKPGAKYACCQCKLWLEIVANDMVESIHAKPLRTPADVKYMEAMGITEEMVTAHHAEKRQRLREDGSGNGYPADLGSADFPSGGDPSI